MTIAIATTTFRPASGTGTGFLTRLRDGWTRRQAFRDTLEQLQMLSPKTLADIDLAGKDLPAAARRAVYGQ